MVLIYQWKIKLNVMIAKTFVISVRILNIDRSFNIAIINT